MIKHIWFDFSDTLAFTKKEAHDNLRYEAYAAAVGKPVTGELIREYEALYEKHGKSNAAAFASLDLPPGYWSNRVNAAPPGSFHVLASATVPDVLKEIKKIVPISLFSNIDVGALLPALGIDPSYFTHILNSRMLKKPKPALEGFYKIIELSKLPPDEILYIGDIVEKDIRPAKAVGMKTALMWEDSDEADYSFKTFEEILEFAKANAKHS